MARQPAAGDRSGMAMRSSKGKGEPEVGLEMTQQRGTVSVSRSLLSGSGVVIGFALFVVMPAMGRASASFVLIPYILALLCGIAKSGSA
jgi:hypothetical protein